MELAWSHTNSIAKQMLQWTDIAKPQREMATQEYLENGYGHEWQASGTAGSYKWSAICVPLEQQCISQESQVT